MTEDRCLVEERGKRAGQRRVYSHPQLQEDSKNTGGRESDSQQKSATGRFVGATLTDLKISFPVHCKVGCLHAQGTQALQPKRLQGLDWEYFL